MGFNKSIVKSQTHPNGNRILICSCEKNKKIKNPNKKKGNKNSKDDKFYKLGPFYFGELENGYYRCLTLRPNGSAQI